MNAIAWALATVLNFCPNTTDGFITGYHCYAYALQLDFGSQACAPGLCYNGIAEGDANHTFRVLEPCSVNVGLHSVFFPDELPGEFVMFSVEPEYDCVPGHCTVCQPGGCADVWWTPSPDLGASCECPGGEC